MERVSSNQYSAKIANLFLIGVAKSGTSTLHDYLSQHPEISGAEKKEPHFFCQKKHDWDLSAYSNLFDQKETIKYRLDSSTGYLMFNDAIDQINETVVDAKFLILLRNPIDRLISHYQWLYGYGEENRDFWTVINSQYLTKPIFENVEGNIGYKHYLAWGFYGEQIGQLFQKVDKSRVRVYFFEDLVKSPEMVLNQIIEFLAISPFVVNFTETIQSNASVNIKYKWFFKLITSNNFNQFKRIMPELLIKLLAIIRQLLTRHLKKITVDKKPFQASLIEREKIKSIYLHDVEKLTELLGLSKFDLPWKDFK